MVPVSLKAISRLKSILTYSILYSEMELLTISLWTEYKTGKNLYVLCVAEANFR